MKTARSITANAFNIERGNYYPFGMEQPGRIDPGDNTYRYGFNGKEKDDEVKGPGNHYDFGLRNYDSRLGRMFNTDPRSPEYPWQTTYAYHRNSPIWRIDFLGGGDPTELLNTNGKVIGTDENGVDGTYAVVYGEDEQKVLENSFNGVHTESSSLENPLKLPGAGVRSSMCDAVDCSNAANESVGDTKGGYHEEGGVYGTSGGSEVAIPAVPGQANMEMRVPGEASINPLIPQDPSNVPSDFLIIGSYHVHPAATKGDTRFMQVPSGPDLINVLMNPKLGAGTHFVFGARNDQIYLFNRKTTSEEVTYYSFPYEIFKSLK